MKDSRVIQFELTYGEYLALHVAATAEISSSKVYLAGKKDHDDLYINTEKRVETLELVLKKMLDAVNTAIEEDVNKKYKFMKG